jgi:RNA polymerase sigma-70 factor (ECF subfamily)
MNDSQLIIACREQDRSAQKALYEQYAPIMMAVCLRYSQDGETARDLLHDGFIQVFAQIGSYSGKGSFEGWLRRIFVNLALENYRKEKKKHLFLEDYRQTQSDDTDVDDANEDLELEGVPRSEILKMIQELPHGYQTVFNLFVFEDMSHKEIAQQLGISETSSRSQFWRAKTMLQKKISIIQEKYKYK